MIYGLSKYTLKYTDDDAHQQTPLSTSLKDVHPAKKTAVNCIETKKDLEIYSERKGIPVTYNTRDLGPNHQETGGECTLKSRAELKVVEIAGRKKLADSTAPYKMFEEML